MSLQQQFRALITGTSGILIYNAAKSSAKLVNFNKPLIKLNDITRSRLRIFFPVFDFRNVSIVGSAALPANWFERSSKTEGMTFGNIVYSRLNDLQNTYDGFILLVHELIHVKQIAILGESNFASQYGDEFLKYGYPAMPLEQEAYSFVANIPFDPIHYIKVNTDLKFRSGDPSTEAFLHWIDKGIDEGRESTFYFNSKIYLKSYTDLIGMYGDMNFKAGVLHWILKGKDEGRRGK
jgi:hypothetical protein